MNETFFLVGNNENKENSNPIKIGRRNDQNDLSAILRMGNGSGPLEGGGNVSKENTDKFNRNQKYFSNILSPNNKSFIELENSNIGKYNDDIIINEEQ